MPAHYTYLKRWRYEREQGIERTMDVAPVREHLARLRAARMTWRAIAEVSGVTASALHSIHKGETTRINRARARAILAVHPDAMFERSNPAGFVPIIGTRRRIRALLAIGWTHDLIAAAAGLPERRTVTLLSQAGHLCSLENHERIKRVYNELSMTPGPSETNRARARKFRHVPPLAWDDDTIDDPSARPAGWSRTKAMA
ncbi:hypothetical protein [Sanguibacter massiliensis]|uniref:hypothetical protein n=1 Tax=Sanguibacter massiliensis TaxID=1973217 RepID=UPI000C81F146|nr:hypothetical protein [Sanguibacter massiliensis]